MLEQSKHWTEYLAVAVEIEAPLVIARAAGEAVLRAVTLLRRHGVSQQAKMDATGPGRWQALGLAFALAADILRTAISTI